MKVFPFHTITPEGISHMPYGPVYHSDDGCFFAKRIKKENKVSGRDGRLQCKECIKRSGTSYHFRPEAVLSARRIIGSP